LPQICAYPDRPDVPKIDRLRQGTCRFSSAPHEPLVVGGALNGGAGTVCILGVSYRFLIKNFKKPFIAAHKKSIEDITGGFAAGAA